MYKSVISLREVLGNSAGPLNEFLCFFLNRCVFTIKEFVFYFYFNCFNNIRKVNLNYFKFVKLNFLVLKNKLLKKE